MISSLFRQATNKPAEDNNNKEAQQALKPKMQIEALTQTDSLKQSSVENQPVPENIDQLSKVVHTLLMESKLEVSKVRPFFWSMVEAYIDRFHIYPFDVVKALFSYLESRDFPADEVRELVKKLEQAYLQQHGEPLRKSTRLIDDENSLDDEVRALRESLKYAALVGDIEEEV